jgi:predicted NBD/HSP70 family sugar kinase
MLDRTRGTVRDLRRDTRSALLWSLYFCQSHSRQELSEATGLSQASVSNVVRDLLDEGVVIEAGSVDSDGGRPRVLLAVNPEYGYVIGVDIGEQGPEVLVHGQTYGWEAVPLQRLLRAGTDLPLHFENCAKTMGQAELWFGAGQGATNAAVVLVGSGVGACLISAGSIYRGATSSAGEWGHTTIVVGGRRCRCGSAGCLEAYVGAEAILERYGRPMPGHGEESGLAALIDSAGTSALAAAIVEETAGYLGAGIANLINLLNPERIILGGWAGLLLGGRMLPAIQDAASRHALRHPFAATSIELGRLGPEAVTLGAATLPVERFLRGSRR